MQLNSLYTTHDMRLSNILQQYDSYSFHCKLNETQYSGDPMPNCVDIVKMPV